VQTRSLSYREALDLTVRTIDLRARSYLVLIITVVTIATASTIGAIIEWSWRPLICLITLVLLCAFFVSFDAWTVARWRRQILEPWAAENLDLETFQQMLSAVRTLPTETVSSMLQPFRVPLSPPARPHDGILRQSVAQVIRGLDTWRASTSTAVAVALVPAAVSAIAATAMHSWAPLVAAALAPPVLWAGHLLAIWRLRSAIPSVTELAVREVSITEFTTAAAHLDWRRVPQRERDRLFEALSSADGLTASERFWR
jgi:hypothetical protein